MMNHSKFNEPIQRSILYCQVFASLLLFSCSSGVFKQSGGMSQDRIAGTRQDASSDEEKKNKDEKDIISTPEEKSAVIMVDLEDKFSIDIKDLVTVAEKGGTTSISAVNELKLFEKMPRGEAQFTKLCTSTPPANVVITKFCVDKVRPKSLIELQQALGLAVTNPTLTARNQNGTGGNPAFAIQGHSSSLVGRYVSAINPRAVIMSPENLANDTSNPNFVVMGFVRGEQLVEIIANNSGWLEFYLLAFRQECNDAPGGCNVGHLLTPYIEDQWKEVSVYRAEDLSNTIVDCFHCHRPTGTKMTMLRMQELRNPWTHWFRDNTDGAQLIADYYAAHPASETYAGIPGAMINASNPAKLENLIRGNGFGTQPNEFQTDTIRTELIQNNGVSATWNRLNAEVIAGRMIPIPYVDLKVTEPALLTKFTQQYKSFVAGTLPLDKFEDHRDILLEDPVKRAQIGFSVAPGTSAKDMLMLACAQCHHSNLDQSISRAKFNVDFSKMEKAATEIEIAIARLKLGLSKERLKKEKIEFVDANKNPVELHRGEHILTMPPHRIKSLTDDQIDQLITYLREQQKLFPDK
jgi:hypothetical protein